MRFCPRQGQPGNGTFGLVPGSSTELCAGCNKLRSASMEPRSPCKLGARWCCCTTASRFLSYFLPSSEMYLSIARRMLSLMGTPTFFCISFNAATCLASRKIAVLILLPLLIYLKDTIGRYRCQCLSCVSTGSRSSRPAATLAGVILPSPWRWRGVETLRSRQRMPGYDRSPSPGTSPA